LLNLIARRARARPRVRSPTRLKKRWTPRHGLASAMDASPCLTLPLHASGCLQAAVTGGVKNNQDLNFRGDSKDGGNVRRATGQASFVRRVEGEQNETTTTQPSTKVYEVAITLGVLQSDSLVEDLIRAITRAHTTTATQARAPPRAGSEGVCSPLEVPESAQSSEGVRVGGISRSGRGRVALLKVVLASPLSRLTGRRGRRGCGQRWWGVAW